MVPFSLGGDAVLPKASCAACATETSKIELYLARHIFHGLRSHVGAPSRKKSLPSTLSATISVGDQEKLVRVSRASDRPFALMLPTWGLPWHHAAGAADRGFFGLQHCAPITSCREIFGLLLELTDDAPDPLVHIASGTLNHILFARAIAKLPTATSSHDMG